MRGRPAACACRRNCWSLSGTAWGATTVGTRAGVSRHAAEGGDRPQHLSQDQRVDASAVRTAGRGRDGGTLGSGDARLGELILPGSGRCGLRGDRLACDEAATPVAVPEAQGEVGEVRAPPGRAPVAVHRPHAPEGAGGQLCVGEGMISNESPARETRTVDSMRGERRRGQGGE